MSRIGLVTTDDESLSGAEPELDTVQDALRQVGHDCSAIIWHQNYDWDSFDLLIIRSPWDYQQHHEEFTQWLETVEAHTRVLNAPDLIRWNSDKVYLAQLAEAGINVGLTTYCSTMSECCATIATYSAKQQAYVVKPNISASSEDTGLFTDSNDRAFDLCRAILATGKTVIIQQAIAEVQRGGERDLVFFNGEFSHAVAKDAILRPGGGYLSDDGTDKTAPATATEAEIQLGYSTLAAVARIAHLREWPSDAALPLYARIDVVTADDEHPILLEAELFEPSLYLRHSTGGVDRFVAAIDERIRS
ncbi:MAG: hypothetical protein Q4P05_07215 [Actinomycetaceae bacterium]|nr:hypothetical protein [Actinomycetaceae bacterium]